jgi:23S rRNA-/tRNA-specific pseudouridylate synthase
MKILDVGKGWIAVDKPVGVASHATDQAEDDALTLLQDKLESDSLLAKSTEWDGFVSCAHRLDRETSGVLLIATRKEAATPLQNAFAPQDKSSKKIYAAILRGTGLPNEGRWAYPITDKSEGRDQPQGKAQARKDAETIFRLVRESQYVSEIEIDLRTGRQHQIRKHAAIAKHAVVGDGRYGEKKYNLMIDKRYGTDRMLLHAKRLELVAPGFSIRVEAPIPREFDSFFGDSK